MSLFQALVLIAAVVVAVEFGIWRRMGGYERMLDRALGHGQSVDASVSEIRRQVEAAAQRVSEVDRDSGPLWVEVLDLRRRVDAIPGVPTPLGAPPVRRQG